MRDIFSLHAVARPIGQPLSLPGGFAVDGAEEPTAGGGSDTTSESGSINLL
jgi:hypothetical protein